MRLQIAMQGVGCMLGALLALGACHTPRERPSKAARARAAAAAQATQKNQRVFAEGAPVPAHGAASPVVSATAKAGPPEGEHWLTAAQVASVDLKTTRVRTGVAPAPMTVSGRLAFDDLQVAHIVPPVNGHVTAVLVKQGDHVHRGDALAVISSPDLAQVVADAESSRADLLAAERDLARNVALFADRAVAEKELEAAKRRFVGAQADDRRARAKSALLGGKEGSLNDAYVVRAPIDGNVIVRNVTVGLDVQGQYENGPTAQELFTLGSLESVWALADVFEMDVPRVHVGDEVAVSVVAFPGESFAGTVDWIAPNVDLETRSTRLRCRLSNAQHRLKPEMFVTMQINVRGQSGVVVPVGAVFYLRGRHYVFEKLAEAAGDGRQRFVQREITMHPDAGGTQVTVLAGLKGEEEIVTQGGILLAGADE